MLDEQLRNILDQCLSEVILLPLSPEQSGSFYSFVQHVYTVYEDQGQLFHQTIMQSLVLAFVYQIAAAYLSIERFNLIRHSASINITASYLNDTVRSVTGFPVTYYIHRS